MSEYLEALSKENEILKTVTDSVVTAANSFLPLPVQVGPLQLSLKKEASSRNGLFCGSLIRFEGPQLSLEIFLALPKDLLAGEASDSPFGGAPEPMDSSAAADLCGEILNIAFGTIDPTLSFKSIKMKSSFPIKFNQPKVLQLVATLPPDSILIPMNCGTHAIHFELFVPGSLNQKWAYTNIAKK